jgi:hypothetical protein
MKIIVIFSPFFLTVGYVVQLLQNEGPYKIVMVTTYVGIRKDYIGKM